MPKAMDDPLFARTKKPHGHGFMIFLLTFALILAILFLVNMVLNRQVQLISQSVTIPSLPSALEGYKILHISDLHGARFGAKQTDLEATIKNSKYNVVCITGDSVGADGDFTPLIELIDLIPDGTPIFLIAGDEDPSPLQSSAGTTNNVKAEFILAAENHGATYLDAPVEVSYGKGTIWICPESFFTLDLTSMSRAITSYEEEVTALPDSQEKTFGLKMVEYRKDVLSRMEEAQRTMLSSDTCVVLSHAPLKSDDITMLRSSESRASYVKAISLILSGHYNNGQCRLPLLGAVYLPEALGTEKSGWFPIGETLSGLVTVHGISQYISPGLGAAKIYSFLPMRFFNAPSVTLLTLTTKMTK